MLWTIAQTTPAPITPAAAPGAEAIPATPAVSAAPAVPGVAPTDATNTTQAPGGTSTAPPKTDAPWWAANPMIPMILIIAVMYFFLFRSKKTQQKKLASMLDNLKKGDRVQTIGGIRGAVVEAREDEVVIKVDESSNAKITFARSAIHKVLEEEKK